MAIPRSNIPRVTGLTVHLVAHANAHAARPRPRWRRVYASPSQPLHGQPVFLDPRVEGRHPEHMSVHANRIALWSRAIPALVNYSWILQSVTVGDFAALIKMLEDLVDTDNAKRGLQLVTALVAMAQAPTKVDMNAAVALGQATIKLAGDLARDPWYAIGHGFIAAAFLSHLSKDKTYAPALAAFYQARSGTTEPLPPLSSLIKRFAHVTYSGPAGSSESNPIAFQAETSKAPNRIARIRVCYAFQRSGQCSRAKCGFSHDPAAIAAAPPPPERAERPRPRGACLMCQSLDHGIDKCPEFQAVKAAKAKATAAAAQASGAPASGSFMAVVGCDEELQQMLNNARDL